MKMVNIDSKHVFINYSPMLESLSAISMSTTPAFMMNEVHAVLPAERPSGLMQEQQGPCNGKKSPMARPDKLVRHIRRHRRLASGRCVDHGMSVSQRRQFDQMLVAKKLIQFAVVDGGEKKDKLLKKLKDSRSEQKAAVVDAWLSARSVDSMAYNIGDLSQPDIFKHLPEAERNRIALVALRLQPYLMQLEHCGADMEDATMTVEEAIGHLARQQDYMAAPIAASVEKFDRKLDCR